MFGEGHAKKHSFPEVFLVPGMLFTVSWVENMQSSAQPFKFVLDSKLPHLSSRAFSSIKPSYLSVQQRPKTLDIKILKVTTEEEASIVRV